MKENKRTVCMITSSNLANAIANGMKKKYPGKSVKLYTGEDLQRDENGITMA